MRRIRKLKERAGFTLAEMLLAILILLMVSSIVATGIPAARNAYEKVVLGSNAQILLSTTVATLRDELGTAWDVKADETSGDLLYFSADTGAVSRLFIKDKTIMLQEFAGMEDIDRDMSTGTARPLVSEAAATSDLYAIYDNVSYDGDSGIVTFSGLKVRRSSNDAVIAETGDESGGSLKIRVFSAMPE